MGVLSPSTVKRGRPLARTLLRLAIVVVGATGAIMCGLFLLLWLTGRVFSDAYLWSQFLLWIPTPAAIMAGLAGLLCAARPGLPWRRRSRLMIWSAVVLATLVYFGAVEHKMLRSAPEPRGLHILHWNAFPQEGQDRAKYFPVVAAMNADITILTDAWMVPWRQPAREWLGEEGHIAFSFPFTILSRVPIRHVTHLVAKDGSYVVRIRLDLSETFGRELVIDAVDLPSDIRIQRLALARDVRAMWDSRMDEPADIVIGDFNITRNSAAMRHLVPGFQHAYDEAGRGYAATFHRDFPLFHIDHALLGPRVRTTAYELIDPGLGRHLMQSVHVMPTMTHSEESERD